MTESTARLVRTTLETFAISLGIIVVSAIALRMIETSVVEARAATVPARLPARQAQPWHAQYLRQPATTIEMRASSRLTYWVEFRNTGTATWTRDDDHFVAMNVTNPTGRASPFRDIFWPAAYRPGRISQQTVAPGETGRFVFALTAPPESGTYTEDFGLVAENLTWITGGHARLTIHVVPTPDFRAELAQTPDVITVDAGEEASVQVGFRNTGRMPWTRVGDHFVAMNVTNPAGRLSAFQDPESWTEYTYRPTRLAESIVHSGQVGQFRFTLQAPGTPGTYTEDFGLVAENLTWITGGTVKLTIRVVASEAASVPQPTVRVGLFATDEAVRITGSSAYTVAGDRTLFARPAGSSLKLRYLDGRYWATVGGQRKSSLAPIRLEPTDPTASVFTIMSYENRPAWNTALNDNTFRHTIEFRHSPVTNRTVVINELPLEWYLYGIAEATDSSPDNYLKALITAERTYALYHIRTNTKHDEEGFHVDATYDQVYRGYGFERRAPKIHGLVDATRGRVVTYDGQVVVTPYFSHSDGRTRSWEEVWSGDPKPWLVSVPDPCCTQYATPYGHGVGMSASGALWFATEKNWTGRQILEYYYTGIAISDLY